MHTMPYLYTDRVPHTMNCNGKLLDLSAPKIMGILNTTPDSFFDGGHHKTTDQALQHVEKMIHEGAHIIDIGGMSSRPGAKITSIQEETDRIMPVLEVVTQTFPDAILSIDTVRAEIARQAIKAGVCIVNDISGGNVDKDMLPTVAKLSCPYILTHMQGAPETMQENPVYKDIVSDISRFFSEKIQQLTKLGVKDIILDPGFGFGKTLSQNYQLLQHLSTFSTVFNLPILAGVSRKSMICKLLQIPPEKALNGTTAAHMLALLQGAKIIRVHDVAEAKEALTIFGYYLSAND